MKTHYSDSGNMGINEVSAWFRHLESSDGLYYCHLNESIGHNFQGESYNAVMDDYGNLAPVPAPWETWQARPELAKNQPALDLIATAIRVETSPDPRGVGIGVWIGTRCVYVGAHDVPHAGNARSFPEWWANGGHALVAAAGDKGGWEGAAERGYRAGLDAAKDGMA